MAEVLSCMEQSLGELVRKVGRLFIESVLETEAEQIAGPRSRRTQERHAYRLGQRRRLLRGGWTTRSHRATAPARARWSRVTFGQLPAISKGERAVDGTIFKGQHHLVVAIGIDRLALSDRLTQLRIPGAVHHLFATRQTRRPHETQIGASPRSRRCPRPFSSRSWERGLRFPFRPSGRSAQTYAIFENQQRV